MDRTSAQTQVKLSFSHSNCFKIYPECGSLLLLSLILSSLCVVSRACFSKLMSEGGGQIRRQKKICGPLPKYYLSGSGHVFSVCDETSHLHTSEK